MNFKRFRRLRNNPAMRALVQETHINKDDFVYPLFIVEGENVKKEISSMPDVFQMSIDTALKECEELLSLGIGAVILFGIPAEKDEIGKDALSKNGIIAKATKQIKTKFPKLFVITDLCFCEYTSHGHCGVLDNEQLDNDETLKNLSVQALIHANAGVDMIAPSGMLDGCVAVLRATLDEAGFVGLPIMSYSTKFASAYYGPFREAAESSPSFGDRKGYQMSPANAKEALAESMEDEKQGADILIVKPALAYLDVIRTIKNNTTLPLAIYNVSGEYSMLKMAGKQGLIDYERALIETMIGFKRAGADIIISYHAKEVANLINQTDQIAL